MDDLMFALLFFLPAAAANAAPVFANKIPTLSSWNTPLDFGKSYKGRRIFGENKKLRGVVFGSFIGALTGALVHLLWPQVVQELYAVPIAPLLNMVLLGAILGLGALIGDAVESFFKRQLGVKPGHSWFPFDQIDFIIGGLLFAAPFVSLSAALIGSVFLIFFGLHLLAGYIAYLLRLKDRPI